MEALYLNAVVVGRPRPRSKPLAMLTMKKSCMVFYFLNAFDSVPIVMVLRLAARRASNPRSSAIREFKQMTTAGDTTAAVTEKV